MAMKPMYSAVVNSPETELAADISAKDTVISVRSAAGLPPAPNLLTIGADGTAETVRYTKMNGVKLTVERGFQGPSKAWSKGTRVARYFTAYDHDTFQTNISGTAANLDKHISDDVKHVNAAERNSWNDKETPEGAQAKADLAETNAKNASLPRSGGTISGNLTVDSKLTVAGQDVVAELTKKATPEQDGRMSKEDKAKLDGIASGATHYVHPTNHPATMIMQNHTHRFVTDDEKARWEQAEANAKNASLPRSGGTISGDLTVANTLTVAGRNVIAELNSVKQSVSDGKAKVARAIADKNVPTSPSDPFQTMADKVSRIEQGLSFTFIYYAPMSAPRLLYLNLGSDPIDLFHLRAGRMTGPPDLENYARFSKDSPENRCRLNLKYHWDYSVRGQILTGARVDVTRVKKILFFTNVEHLSPDRGGTYTVFTFGVSPESNSWDYTTRMERSFEPSYVTMSYGVSVLDVTNVTGDHHIVFETRAPQSSEITVSLLGIALLTRV